MAAVKTLPHCKAGKAGKGKRAAGKVKAAAAVPRSKRRASVRVRSFVRMGGRFLKSGVVPILLPPSSGVVWAGMGGAGGVAVKWGRSAVAPAALGRAVAASLRRQKGKVAAGVAGRVRAGLAAAGAAGLLRVEADSVERRAVAVVELDAKLTRAVGAAAWSLDAGGVVGAFPCLEPAGGMFYRLEPAGDAVEAAKRAVVSPAERAALRAGKRAARRAVVQPRPVHALRVGSLAHGVADAAAARLSSLAEQATRAWVRRWEASGGRPIDGDNGQGLASDASKGGHPAQFEELLCIYRAEMGKAVAACGMVPPDMRALYAVGCDGCGLSWRGWVAWRRALRVAGKLCRSSMWGKGAELLAFASVEAMAENARAVADRRDADSCETRETCETLDKWGAVSYVARLGASKVRALSVAYGERLAVYWMLSGSRKWKSALAGDLALLRAMSRLAMGQGSGVLGDYLTAGGEAGGALREAMSQLGKRQAAGRLMLSGADTGGTAAAVLEQAQSGRAARRAARRAAAAAVPSVGDVVGSAH